MTFFLPILYKYIPWKASLYFLHSYFCWRRLSHLPITKEKTCFRHYDVLANPGVEWQRILRFLAKMSLRNRTGEERRRQNLVWQAWQYIYFYFPTNFTFLLIDLYYKDRNIVMLSEDRGKKRKLSPITNANRIIQLKMPFKDLR